jgi:hypothetical protein
MILSTKNIKKQSAASIYLAWQSAHGGKCCHVKNNSCASYQLFFVNFASAANNIAWSTAGLDNNFKKDRFQLL